MRSVRRRLRRGPVSLRGGIGASALNDVHFVCTSCATTNGRKRDFCLFFPANTRAVVGRLVRGISRTWARMPCTDRERGWCAGIVPNTKCALASKIMCQKSLMQTQFALIDFCSNVSTLKCLWIESRGSSHLYYLSFVKFYMLKKFKSFGVYFKFFF